MLYLVQPGCNRIPQSGTAMEKRNEIPSSLARTEAESSAKPRLSSEVRVNQADSMSAWIDSLKNALVPNDNGDWVRLRNGECIWPTGDTIGQTATWASIGLSNFVLADLDSDGHKDAIALLSECGGGSGIFNSLVVLLNRNGSAKYAAAYFIGDREYYDSIKVSGRVLDVFFKIHGPDDPSCCPSLNAERKLIFLGDTLIEVDESKSGQ